MRLTTRRVIHAATSWLMVVPIALSTLGCAASGPEIGRHLPSAFDDANRAFDARIKEHFPIGSPERALIAELKHQGFKISENAAAAATEAGAFRSFALYDAQGLPCRLDWKVLWSSEGPKITAIAGRYSGVCL